MAPVNSAHLHCRYRKSHWCGAELKESYLKNNRVDDIRITDRQIQRHAAGRCHCETPYPLPLDPTEPLPVVHHHQCQHCHDTRTKRVTNESERVTRIPLQEVPQNITLSIKHPLSGLEQAIVHIATIEHPLSKLVVQQHGVVTLFRHIHTPNSEHDIQMRVVNIQQGCRSMTISVLICSPVHHPPRLHAVTPWRCSLWVLQVILIDREDQPAQQGNRLKLCGRC
uniref:Uncharacterized protein n=1 Tax=Arundo donax TaxID=35708 RepID=A0A0A9DVL5_ARUDO